MYKKNVKEQTKKGETKKFPQKSNFVLCLGRSKDCGRAQQRNRSSRRWKRSRCRS